MSVVSPEVRDEIRRSVTRAKAVLKAGDRLLVGMCGNGRGSTVTMTGWSDDFPGFITTKSFSADEIHPYNIRKVNGEPMSFRDEGGEA